jgi:hypothetical protein
MSDGRSRLIVVCSGHAPATLFQAFAFQAFADFSQALPAFDGTGTSRLRTPSLRWCVGPETFAKPPVSPASARPAGS